MSPLDCSVFLFLELHLVMLSEKPSEIELEGGVGGEDIESVEKEEIS